MSFEIKQVGGAVVIDVKVVAGSSRTQISSSLGGSLKVNVAAAAEKGKANKALVALLAKIIGCGKSAISITAGQHHPRKQLTIVGVSAKELREKINPHLPPT